MEITHGDVCQDGFLLNRDSDQEVNADAIFLDLPAPWLALENLTRSIVPSDKDSKPDIPRTAGPPSLHLLNPRRPVHICTFSPCIEQVQRTITVLRQKGWLDIDCVELAAKRLEVKRERVTLQEDSGQRGVTGFPTTVDEAVSRLRVQEKRVKIFHEESSLLDGEEMEGEGEVTPSNSGSVHSHTLKRNKQSGNPLITKDNRKLYAEGLLTHRSETELKTHTSYLVFAVLPQEWSAKDEEQMRAKWPAKVEIEQLRKKGNKGETSRRQMKRVAKEVEGGNKMKVGDNEAGVGVDGPGTPG